MVVGNVTVELHAPEAFIDLVLVVTLFLNAGVTLIRAGIAEQRINEQAVPQNGARGVDVEGRVVVLILGICRKECVRALVDLNLVVSVDANIPCVRAALRTRIDDAAEGTAVFGRVTTGLDLQGLVELERDLREADARAEVGRVKAVQEAGILGDGSTGEADDAIDLAGTSESVITECGARGQQRHRLQVALYRQFEQCLAVDDEA